MMQMTKQTTMFESGGKLGGEGGYEQTTIQHSEPGEETKVEYVMKEKKGGAGGGAGASGSGGAGGSGGASGSGGAGGSSSSTVTYSK